MVCACVVHVADKSITMYFAYIENIPMYTFPQVPLGVLKNENTTADMIEIMEHVLKYAPVVEKTKPILFSGDQVTCERATSAQNAKSHQLI